MKERASTSDTWGAQGVPQKFFEAEVQNRLLFGMAMGEVLHYLASLPDGPDIKETGDKNMFLINDVFCDVEDGKCLLEQLMKALHQQGDVGE